MIKEYSFKGTPFQTIIIPKGTVLFRGLNYDSSSNYMTIFNDLVGYPGSQYYAIDPNMNVFFYPVPYVSDSVKVYDIHIMYITQYDIELLLLLKPSDISRGDKENKQYEHIFTTCDNLGKKNKCAQDTNGNDPCFTEDVLKLFPQIDGYIGIAEQDAEIITKKYKDIFYKYDNVNKTKQLIPSILSNSRGIISIPEIVIHPYRFRYDNCHLITEKFYNSERVVKYCINNRAQYNFFPLLYFTSNNIYTFTDLKLNNTIKEISKNSRIYNEGTPAIYNQIDSVFTKMLEDGYKINSVLYKVLIDKRTGFYRAFIDVVKNNRRNTRKKIFRNFKDDTSEGYLDSYIIKKNDPQMNTIISIHKNYIDDFLNDLFANDYSAKKSLVLSRGNKRNFMYKYQIDKVLDRPDLKEYQNYRRRTQNITNKRTNNYFNSSLKFVGFKLSDLDDVGSVSSISTTSTTYSDNTI